MALHPSVISNRCGVGFEDTHHCAHGEEGAAFSLTKGINIREFRSFNTNPVRRILRGW